MIKVTIENLKNPDRNVSEYPEAFDVLTVAD